MNNEEKIIELLTEIRDLLKKPEKKKTVKFVKPTVCDLRFYCDERENKVDPKTFYDFYESKNWFIGKSKMKDWKACVRTWEKRKNGSHQQNNKPSLAERVTENRKRAERQIDEQSMGKDGAYIWP